MIAPACRYRESLALSRFLVWRWVIGAAILVALITLVVSGFTEETEFLELARRAQPWWLSVAVALQVGTYLCAGAVLKFVLARAGNRLPLRDLARLVLAKLFMDHAVPTAGMSGTLLVIRGLQQHGISRPIAISAMIIDNVAYYAAFLLVVGATLAIVWYYHDLNEVLVGLAALIVLLAISIPGALLWITVRPARRIPAWLRRFRQVEALLSGIAECASQLVRDQWLLVSATMLQLAVFVLDAATLEAMLYAVGHPTGAAAAFASFVVATMTATVGPIPGGLGTFEGASIAMLALFRVKLGAALEATLLLRGFTLWLPMLPGVWVTRRWTRSPSS